MMMAFSSLAAHSVFALSGPAEVAAGVARASTPLRDRPVSEAVAAAALLPFGGDLALMWSQATARDGNSSTDCRAFMLQYEFSLRLMPERAPLRDVFDALSLTELCDVTPPTMPPSTAFFKPLTSAEIASTCPTFAFYVDPIAGSDSDANLGTRAAPFKTIPRALSIIRATGAHVTKNKACIILRGGTHFLASTIQLGAADSGLIIAALAGDDEPAWVSGGVPLGNLSWTAYNTTGSMNVWVADVPASVPITAMPGLNILKTGEMPERLWRAMYPNYDMEQFNGPLMSGNPGATSEVTAWIKPPIMDIPTTLFKSLAGLKNNSKNPNYNTYGAAKGGVCEHWGRVNDDMWSYVCSNITAGGWEEVEESFADSGQLGFPVGVVYNKAIVPSWSSWTMPAADPSDWSNSPVLTQSHNQGWYQASYAVTGIDTVAGVLNMSADGVWPAGGWQGGRTMENCNPDNFTIAEPLCSGPWYVRNVFEELDNPGEYFFDPAARKLYVFYNATSGTPPPANWGLVVSSLEVFFNLTGNSAAPVDDITFAGLGFRDQRTAQLDKWVDPSGGDWGIRRAGLFHLEGTSNVNISGSTFYRTDANSVMIAGWNRNASVVDCEFDYIGMSAVVTFGNTVQDDGTDGQQPWGTVMAYNKVREMGLYQLQSSAWFTSRATLTRAEGLVVFNIPRAAINFNDAFGGGNNVSMVSIFNTCRRSGDHGPMNSWDRMPFLTTIKSGGHEATYDAALSETSHSMIIANYGASQAFDNGEARA